MMGLMVNWDAGLFNLINGVAHFPALDLLMLLVSQSALPLFGIFFVILFFLAARRERDFREFVFLLLASLLGFFLVVGLAKDLLARPRPALTLSRVVLVGPHQEDYSFPSGHAFSIALLAALVARKKDSLFLFFLPYAFLVGFSRIYLGVHYPSDVFVGLGLGFLYGLFLDSVVDRFIEHKIFRILKFHLD